MTARVKRKRHPARDVLLPILGPLDGARIPGGCDHCDAFQTTAQVQPMIWTMTVHHDDACPWYVGNLNPPTQGATA